jgi:hypothetical protein
MPEFILNTPPSPQELRTARLNGFTPKRAKVHPYYALSEFARGYVEAMFFTNGDTCNENENSLNDLGVSRLTVAAVKSIAADCAKFESDNRASLDAALALEPGGNDLEWYNEPLDDVRLGRRFWYARQGHGVGFTDDGTANCLGDLQDAAQAFGESYVETYRGWINVR